MNTAQKFSKIISVIFKNLLAFLVGGVLGILNFLLFAKPLLAHSVKNDIGLGVVVAAPLLIIFYSILFGLGGGILAVFVYNIIKFVKRKKGVL